MKNKVDLMFISEPNRKICSKECWFMDKRGDVAVKVCSRTIELEGIKLYNGYICVSLPKLKIYATYIPPNVTMQRFKESADAVFEKAAQQPQASIILGDLNSKSEIWGSPRADLRGEHIEGWLSQLRWGAANSGKHTFERAALGATSTSPSDQKEPCGVYVVCMLMSEHVLFRSSVLIDEFR
ncbi:uncharacterized protein LOC123313924 [Coccinella septempunctata]|uniref:uncharacterized protein LOC123313924 n=1 Tax=Coccinella septempunctata TaxID=41139 RepID=UPI001D0621BE|nr:uncharacterized protein LOC123313924 [Coccinella septempunctata]